MDRGRALEIPLAGGQGALGALVWDPPGPARRAVVLVPALGTTQRYQRHLAADLAGRGWAVLSFDYRGMGASPAPGDRRALNLDAWGEDLDAAVQAARGRFGVAPVALGHSLGGMLLGHGGVGSHLAGAVALTSALGDPALYGRGRARLRLELAYRLLPPLARLRGELPGFVFGAPVPRDVVRHWTRWGRQARYSRWEGASSGERFARFTGPLLGVAVADDDYAPLAAVEAHLRAFPRARTRRELLTPRAGERVGHFGLFRPDAPTWTRDALHGWLSEVAG